MAKAAQLLAEAAAAEEEELSTYLLPCLVVFGRAGSNRQLASQLADLRFSFDFLFS